MSTECAAVTSLPDATVRYQWAFRAHRRRKPLPQWPAESTWHMSLPFQKRHCLRRPQLLVTRNASLLSQTHIPAGRRQQVLLPNTKEMPLQTSTAVPLAVRLRNWGQRAKTAHVPPSQRFHSTVTKAKGSFGFPTASPG